MKKFLQKLLKKPLALVMALLIVLGSISVAVYALYDGDSGTLKTYIQITKEDGTSVSYTNNGTIVDNAANPGALAVKKGDKIKVNISLETHFDKKAEGSKDTSVFNLYTYCPMFSFDADLLEFVWQESYAGNEDGYTAGDVTFVDGKTYVSDAKEIDFTGDSINYDYKCNNDKFVDFKIGDKYYSYIFAWITLEGSTADLDSTSGSNIMTFTFAVREDADLDNLIDDNYKLKETPFRTVSEAYGTMEKGYSDAEYPAFVTSLDDTGGETNSHFFSLTTEEYAETLSFGGSVTFDTNSTAYGGLAGGKLDTSKCTNVNATEQVDSNNTGTGVYSAVTLAGTALSSTTTPSVTCTDTNIKFLGWSKTQNSTSAADVLTETELAAITYSTNPTTLYAVYSNEDTYTLVIDYDDGVTENATFTGLTYGQAIPAEALAILADTNKPTKTGSSFAAWIPTIGTLKQVDSSFAAMADANKILTITATWNINQHDIKYILNDDTGYTDTTENVNYGTSLDEADQPDADSYKKTGYSNEGEWAYYTDEACKVPYEGDTMPDQNLYAVLQWTENTYKFSFDNDNADAVTGDAATTTASKDVKFGEALTLTAPEKAGYTFQGWDLNGDETADINVGTESVTIDTKFVTNYLKDGEDEKTGLTAKALWTQNTYTITFTTGTTPDGSNITANETIKTFTYVYGDKFEGQKAIPTATSDPDKLSYNDTAAGGTVTATGWEIANAKIEDGGYIPLPEDGKATLTVPAQWTKLYTVTFKFNDGKTTDSVSKLAAGKEIKVPELPTYEGHTFAYWYTVDENTEVKPAATVDADNPTDLTYIAKWTVNKHSVSYYLDDNKLDISESEVPYGTAVTVKDLATPAEGYQLNETAWTVTGATVGTDGKFTMPDNDVTLKLTTKAKNYDFIIHYGDYQKLGDNTQQVAYKAATPEVKDLEAWTDANNIRHTFKGWEIKVNGAVVTEIPTTMPYYTVELTPVWDDYYTLTYDYNDGTTEKETHEIISGGALVDANTPNPTKEGYSFGGWTYTDATGATISKPATMTSNVTATATWNINQYTVKYTIKDCDKAVWNNVSKTNEDYITAGTDYNSAIPAAQNSAVKDGYDFKGWSYASESGLAFAVDENTKMPAFNLVATPKFEAKDVVTTIKDGDKDVYSGTVKFDTPIDKDGTIKPAGEEGKEEGKWYVRNDDGTKTEIDLKKPLDGQISYRSPLTIEAIYTVTDKYYIANGVDKDGNFTYDTTAVKAITEETGYEYTVPGAEVAVSEKYADAFEFKGWATKPNDAVSVDTSVTTSKLGDTSNNYYAVYDLKEYTVTFLNEDGTVYDQKTYKFGAEIDQPDDPEKLGYTFQYWNDADGKKVDDYGVMPAKNLTFSPYFMSNDVSATFMKKKVVGDEYVTFETVKETVGEAIKTPDGTNSYNPFKLGYKFTGWADENGKSIDEYTEMPNGNIKFYAQYELDETAIALTVGGVVVSGAVVGTALAANAALITTGAVVGGVAVVAGAAALAKHTHKVTYYVDGEVYKTYYCVEGTKVLTPDDPSKDGYTFACWDNEIPEKMPANDLEFNATWSGNVDDEIPDTGSATAGLAAFAVISSAAAAAYVLTKKKKDEE